MTAHIGSDENPKPSQEPDSSEPQAFIYDDDSHSAEYDASYVPEREFVLMPLFRRVGEMLGIRWRSEAPESMYKLEPSAPAIQAIQQREPIAHAAERTETESAESEDLLGIERTALAEPELLTVEQRALPEREPQISALPPVWKETPSQIIAPIEPFEPEPVHSQMKIPDDSLALEPVPAPQAEVSSPKLERLEAPALQRELAWREHSAASEPEAPFHRQSAPVYQRGTPKAVERRLQLVDKPATLPFWKRIDWAQQFTPKRVAALGGLAMATLLIVGVSVVRRPASSALPQQMHSVAPGGVTLSTHPKTSVVSAPARAQRRTVAAQRGSVTPATHRAASYDDGPDVVTHYYTQQKPSPVKQSTVAGVRHYSDIQ